MTTPSIRSHDLVLTDGTTTLGLSLAKDKSGRPILIRRYVPSLVAQQFETLSEAAFPSEYQTYVTQKEWHGGFGKENYSAKRYWLSDQVDASWGEMVMPGPVVVDTTNTAPTYASTATIANGTFETGDLTSWTVVTQGSVANWAVVAAAKRSGTYGASVKSATNTNPEIKQKLTAADCSLFNGLTLAISAYAKLVIESAATFQVHLKDASGTTIASSGVIDLSTTFQEAAISHAFTDGWPELWVHIVFTPVTSSDEFYLDDVTVTLTGTIATAANMGTVVELVDFNALHYAVSETGVWKRTAANWVRVVGSPDLITAAESDGTNLYLARGTSKNYWFMSTADAFTRCTGTGASAKVSLLCLVGGSMYGAASPQTVYLYSVLSSGATTRSYSVGQLGYNITALVNYLETPYTCKENGLFYLSTSSSTVTEVMPEMRSMFNADTGKQSIEWWADLYVPAGEQALMQYRSAAVDNIGPARYFQNLTPIGVPSFAKIVALASDGDWLYAFCEEIYEGVTTVYLFKGREETLSGVTPATAFRWHCFAKDTRTVNHASVSTITAKRLWFTGGTGKPSYVPLSTNYPNPWEDTNLTFQTGGYFYTGWYDFGLPNVNKILQSFKLYSTRLDTNRTVVVAYRKYGDTTFTTLGTFTTSPIEEKFFYTAIANAPSTTQVMFRFQLTNDLNTIGSALFGFTCYAVLNPARLELIEAQVQVPGVLSNGAPDPEMDYKTVAPNLHAMADVHPLTLTIPDGTSDGVAFTVKFAEGYPRETFLDVGNADEKEPRSLFDLGFVAARTS